MGNLLYCTYHRQEWIEFQWDFLADHQGTYYVLLPCLHRKLIPQFYAINSVCSMTGPVFLFYFLYNQVCILLICIIWTSINDKDFVLLQSCAYGKLVQMMQHSALLAFSRCALTEILGFHLLEEGIVQCYCNSYMRDCLSF